MRLLRHIPWRSAVYYFLTGLILAVPALMNGSPLVYSDTGTYLATSRTLLPPIDRPIGYALIIRAVTWQSTLWTVVFFQGMVASWLVRRTMQALLPAMGTAWRPHVVVLAVLLAISSLPWYASQLMPDVFSGYLALCMFLLLFGRGLAKFEVFLLWVVLYFSGIAHFSHLVMLLLAVCALLFVALRGLLPGWPARRSLKTLAGLLSTPVVGILFLMGYNARHGQGVVLSPTSSLFLAGKLIESGVMYTHLERTCASRPVFLCDHMAELNASGMHYVWNDDAPTRQGLDMVEASRRLDPVVHGILADPGMWPMLAWTSAVATVVQFTQVNIGSGLHSYREESAPWWPISHHWQHELPLYMNSVQQRNLLGFGHLNALNMLVLACSCLVLIVRWPPVRRVRWWVFVLLMAGMSVANAAATGALANVYDRLQARITWLLVFAALLLLLHASAGMRRLFLIPARSGEGRAHGR